MNRLHLTRYVTALLTVVVLAAVLALEPAFGSPGESGTSGTASPGFAQARNPATIPAAVAATAASRDNIAAIERVVVWSGRKAGKSSFQPRTCLIPSADKSGKPTVFMALQEITGSDFYGPVHWTMTTDLGQTWCVPEPIPGLGRHTLADGLEEGVCDVVPQFHPPTGTVLAMGHNVYYKAGKLTKPGEDRFPVYVVRGADGRWSERHRLQWNDPRGSGIYTCGCGQRLVLENGDILAPIYFAAKGQKTRSVTTFQCAFDGRTLTVKRVGNALTNPAGRGLLEPSLARSGGEYLMTIRAEDGHGYVARSNDGLHWAQPQPWTFDDGEPLAMSSTQQHWLAHGDRLYLVYTRKTTDNARVMRWRAPLFIAAVDSQTLRLQRSTERVVFPLESGDPAHAARMGNFHTLAISPLEGWVTVGEARPAAGYKGDLLLARIRWSTAYGH